MLSSAHGAPDQARATYEDLVAVPDHLVAEIIDGELHILPVLLLVHVAASAQTSQFIPRESIADTVIGWMRLHDFTGARKPLKVDDKLYSPAQLSMADAFASWMQASYNPRGGLGEVRLFVSDKLGLYSLTDAALPQTYGATAKTYLELKYDAQRKMVPAMNSHLRWSITANGVGARRRGRQVSEENGHSAEYPDQVSGPADEDRPERS